MIRVLVVEDSPTVLEFLIFLLTSDPAIEVVGTAQTGEEAVSAVACTRPDIVTMDVHMPKMNGFDATRRIMETHPTPIVIVSETAEASDATKAFRAIEAGALAILQKPPGPGHPDHEESRAELLRTVKLMSEVRVVRRWPRSALVDSLPATPHCKEFQFSTVPRRIKVVAIGASTGGPPVLQTILSGLPQDFPVPILIVQHIAAGFCPGLVDWLKQSSKLPIHLARQGQLAIAGSVFVAPDGFHMAMSAGGFIELREEDPEYGLRPSVSCLFRSVAKTCGSGAIGVLLTGMGKDGASELKLMKEQGAVTIAQDRETSVVHGMPGEAIKMGAASYILSAEKIHLALATLAGQHGMGHLPAVASEQENGRSVDSTPLASDLSGSR